MAEYVDGFLIAVPKKNLKRYKKDALLARKVWLEYGALDYRECVGDDLSIAFGKTFPALIRLKSDESLIFAWITFPSKAARKQINAKVMKDPRMHPGDKKEMPFKINRLSYGGFTTLVKK